MSTERPAYKYTCGDIIYKTHKLETTQKFTNRYILQRFWNIHIIKDYSAMKRKKLLIPATTWLNLKNTLLSKKYQMQKKKNYVCAYVKTYNSQN